MTVSAMTVISDLTQGGAAIACRRLCTALKRHGGADVTWIAAQGESGEGARVALEWPDALGFVAHRFLRRAGLRRMEDRSRRWMVERTVAGWVRSSRPAVINLHNIHENMTAALLDRLPPGVPVLWTLHDMWPLTGYCYQSRGCVKYAAGCRGDCPEWGRWGGATGRPETEWRRRQAILVRHARRLTLIAPSRWMEECARRRFPGGVGIRHIPNAVDTDIFRPLNDRAALRRALGLPVAARIVMTGAQWIDMDFKGTPLLAEAMRRLAGQRRDAECVVITCGGRNAGEAMVGGADWRSFGVVRDERLMNMLYNAADIFVLPSLAENLPNMLIESAAAGTPAIAFDVGGCGEIIRHGATGCVIAPGDVGGLAAAIRDYLDMGPEWQIQWRQAAREGAVKEYALTVQAGRYGALLAGGAA